MHGLNQEDALLSDEHLYQAVRERLAADARIDSPSLRLGVLNGIVHLAGALPTVKARRTAAELAGSVPGVRGVVNRIDAPGAPPPARTINLKIGKGR